MKLSGMISKVMDNYVCLRGIANIEKLAEMSEVNPDIQRTQLEKHRNEMKEFLERGEYAFFPEVVLSLNVGLSGNDETFENFVATVDSPKEGYKNNIGKVKVNFRADENKYIDDRRKLKIAQLEFDEKEVRLSRIDGNHRLSVATDLNKKDILIPFCIIIFSDKDEAENTSRAIFHNINSKQIPLKLEQNLKIIIDTNDVFTDEILEKNQPFGFHYKCTRELLCGERKIDFMCFPLIAKFIKDNEYSFFVDLFRHLLENKLINKNNAVATVKSELVNVETALKESKIITSSQNCSIIGALAYYKLADKSEDKSKYNKFIKWIEKNHLAEANVVGIDDIINIFDKVYESTPKKVFLARWYPSDDKKNSIVEKARQRCEAIEKVISELNLELVDLGTHKGATFSIPSVIHKEISEADIFIADLTGCRPNVMLEVGCALNSNKLNFDKLKPDKGRIILYFSSTEEHPNPPFDISSFQYETISDSSEITTKIKPRIEAILAEI
jgi:hypothetical protein